MIKIVRMLKNEEEKSFIFRASLPMGEIHSQIAIIFNMCILMRLAHLLDCELHPTAFRKQAANLNAMVFIFCTIYENSHKE